MSNWENPHHPPGPPKDWFMTSTRFGNMFGAAMRAAAFTFDYALPLVAITSYRLIPDSTRGKLFGGPSASLGAILDLHTAKGGGWQIIKMAASNHPPRPHLP
jgi:hypothetical protein